MLAGVLVAIGSLGLIRPTRVLTAAVTFVGLMLVIATVFAGYPAKAADTDELLDSLRPFSASKVQARQAGLVQGRTYIDGYRDDVLPGVALDAEITEEQVYAELAAADPALASENLAEVEEILVRFDALVDISAYAQPRLVAADTISATNLMRLVLGGGILLMLAGAVGLLDDQRRGKPQVTTAR